MFSFVLMKAFDLYNKRHKQVANLLGLQKARLEKKNKQNVFAGKVAKELELSSMTVINYTNGKIGDGYLAEAILEELKKIK